MRKKPDSNSNQQVPLKLQRSKGPILNATSSPFGGLPLDGWKA